MSVSLNIYNRFTMDAQGITYAGKHGAATLADTDPFVATVNGKIHNLSGSVATGAVATVWNTADDVPTTFANLFYWADQITYIQLIGSSQSVVFKVAAFEPFVIPGYGLMTAAASSTAITGGAEPTPAAITSVVIGNYSGNTANYVFAVIN